MACASRSWADVAAGKKSVEITYKPEHPFLPADTVTCTVEDGRLVNAKGQLAIVIGFVIRRTEVHLKGRLHPEVVEFFSNAIGATPPQDIHRMPFEKQEEIIASFKALFTRLFEVEAPYVDLEKVKILFVDRNRPFRITHIEDFEFGIRYRDEETYHTL